MIGFCSSDMLFFYSGEHYGTATNSQRTTKLRPSPASRISLSVAGKRRCARSGPEEKPLRDSCTSQSPFLRILLEIVDLTRWIQPNWPMLPLFTAVQYVSHISWHLQTWCIKRRNVSFSKLLSTVMSLITNSNC